jgi:ankyrin repeat protein
MSKDLFRQISQGRTDLVFEYLAAGQAATSKDESGASLIKWCAYYGDVSAIRFLLANGESLESLGDNLDLNGAAFHGHWQLCQFLIEQGADVNKPLPDTGETPLHAALCTADRRAHDLVIKVLLAHGADPNRATKLAVETGCFMRDCRTGRNAAPSRGGFWERGNDRDVAASGSNHRYQGHEWRFSTDLGELVSATGFRSPKALLR